MNDPGTHQIYSAADIGFRSAWPSFVAPKPVFLIVTRSDDGRINIAPFSSIACVSNQPPMIVFSIGSPRHRVKETRQNLRAGKELVLCTVTASLAESVMLAAAHDDSCNDFERVGLTPLQISDWALPAIADSPAAALCTAVDVRQLQPGRSTLVIAEVNSMSIQDKALLPSGEIDVISSNGFSAIGLEQYLCADGAVQRWPRTWD